MANREKLITDATESLLNMCSPGELQSWLFDLQNETLANTYRNDYTKKGSQEIASKFAVLKQFFEQLGKV